MTINGSASIFNGVCQFNTTAYRMKFHEKNIHISKLSEKIQDKIKYSHINLINTLSKDSKTILLPKTFEIFYKDLNELKSF